MSHEKVVAVYDTAAHADAAINTLKSAGYSATDISVIRNENDATAAGLLEPAFWRDLFGHEFGAHGHNGAESCPVLQGRTVVSVRVPESDAPKVVKLLDVARPGDVLGRPRTYTSPAEPTKSAIPSPAPAAALRKDEELVRLAEEQLSVGKRQVEAGVTRVRRFVVEKPVEASVSLHEEHAEVMRRAISNPNEVKDIDWSERTIEVTETAEQPVVSKTVRVAEEVIIRKKGSDHVETVHDTVRRQQLDIERVPVEAGRK
jgi:uncharacterized protein (TIGR02271 family)